MYYGSVRSFGIVARGWSRTGVDYASATSATAYGLYANASGVYPSNGPNYRYYGFPAQRRRLSLFDGLTPEGLKSR